MVALEGLLAVEMHSILFTQMNLITPTVKESSKIYQLFVKFLANTTAVLPIIVLEITYIYKVDVLAIKNTCTNKPLSFNRTFL